MKIVVKRKYMATSKKHQKPKEEKPQKSQLIILQHTEEAALTQLKRNSRGLSLSALTAGLDIGFSLLLMTIMFTAFESVFPAQIVHLIVSNMYPIGFVFVILGRSELFTEHTTLAILPVLQKLASIKKLLRLWLIVYAFNLAGGFLFALILSFLSKNFHFLQPDAFLKMAEVYLVHDWQTNLIVAILAGWLMGLLAWLVAASRETISQIVIIWIITASIGFANLPHCIVGNIEVATAWIMGYTSLAQYVQFMWSATAGNIIGGVLFVGILKFSHAIDSGEEAKVDLESISKQGAS